MELKHKECFCPATIEAFGLQGVSRYARETYEYVNLYSVDRGVNRFPALQKMLALLRQRQEVVERGIPVPTLQSLEEWIQSCSALGTPALEAYCAEHTQDTQMQTVLAWNAAVNTAVGRMVKNVPPFSHVRESLAALQGRADVMVLSATPSAAVGKEWREHDLLQYVSAACGQEYGTKKDCIAQAATLGYAPERMLMIGDALGDLQAARASGALFYPIEPGREAGSWASFITEGLPRFLSGTYQGAYEEARVHAFSVLLPAEPPWTKKPEALL
ncbi:MAG: HAD hydrolase-like protein [Eubacteriales bacterium]|nr:HAD hydrolase-like protein [Eubacteriales bacterium]